MLSKLLTGVLVLIVLVFGIIFYHHQSPRASLISNDVSWPNCNYEALVNSNTGIIGVNGGLDFRLNPCPQQEASWFSNYGLYINTGYPGTPYSLKYESYPKTCSAYQAQCLAYNWGYNATKFSINYSNLQAAHSRSWWLDVETDNSWTNNIYINRASLQGAINAIKHYVFMPTIGVYSDGLQWNTLVGNWNIRYPAWIATGSSSLENAKSACVEGSFDEGEVWLSQYTTNIDNNLNCTQQFNSTVSNLN